MHPFDDRETLDFVVDAVRALPERQRLVVVLHYWLDTSIEEIAAYLEIPVGTVVSRLSRARAALREELPRRTEGVNVIRAGFSEELDRLRELLRGGDGINHR